MGRFSISIDAKLQDSCKENLTLSERACLVVYVFLPFKDIDTERCYFEK